MNYEEDPLDNFFRKLLKDQLILSPPSADYQSRVMQRVAASPTYQHRRSDRLVLIGGVLLTLVTTLGAGYWLLTYWPAVLSTVGAALQWLPWNINPTWVAMALVYGLLARALLTFGMLAAVDRRRGWLMMQYGA